MTDELDPIRAESLRQAIAHLRLPEVHSTAENVNVNSSPPSTVITFAKHFEHYLRTGNAS